MRRMKKILIVLAAVILVLPSFLATASTNDSNSEEVDPKKDGEVSSKDEVVYATLSATGEGQEIYVVNTLDVEKEGKIVDYGSYTSLKNLTDLSEIEQVEDKVQFTAPKGKFYYQGNMNDEPLPWDISITYFLDGEEISPEDLAGKDGHVQIRIETSANEDVNRVFFENYLLQIALTLDSTIYNNIKTEDGMVANAGKNKQVTFTVMPENEEELVVEADVEGFELEGIEISGVPSSMSIESPDIGEMTGDMKSLTDAISDLNNGVAELNDGVSELNNGVADLEEGSKQYQNGISDLDDASTDLVNGSKDIEQALETISDSLGNSEGMDLSELGQLADGLTQLSNGLKETSEGLTLLKDNYANAYRALDGAMEDIPAYNISEEEIQKLYSSGADQRVVDQLVDTYVKAQTAKGTYAQVKGGFDAVDVTLEEVIGALNEMATNLDSMANGLSSSLEGMDAAGDFAQLQEGLATLSSNYKEFHAGLVDYTGGVNQLSNSYQELHSGIEELSVGTNELDTGVGELYDGTSELHESTSDLPDQMTEEIDEMMADYDKSDFEAVSFVSTENEKINSVQFVFKTKSIMYEEPETTEEPVEEAKGFWARLKDLFS
ncbi:YhgE/Pip domain-containing protein [Ornithinibacillus sp. L9]|uniref:YhgE/Pip domain-containing protein n=1 Tax=Ornithinibacillus caprae TaxID=2678566 RepID=A0A6N8FQI1_9BACI|nr:YhgE/Pip domain-containing protein [Ornithinibacillus caprae]MUK90309.1 YhgE/Pip domain-containing protein [Ornithinibacillus caprae]